MTVLDFLSEENYDNDAMPSGVPDYLADEDDDYAEVAVVAEPTPTPTSTPTIPSSAEWREAADRGEVKGYEHPNKGKDPNSASKKNRKPGTKYHRRDMTDKDLIVLAFLERFKLATTKQMAILLGVKRGSANWRLLGLKEIGLVDQERIPTMPVLWFLKPKGKKVLDNAFHFDNRAPKNLHNPGAVSSGTISHVLFEGQIAAQIVAGLRPLDRIEPLEQLSGIEKMAQIVDETFLRSSWGKETFNKMEDSKQAGQRGYVIATRAAESLVAGKVSYSEVLEENPSMWTLTVPPGWRNDCKEFHYPDLVIDLEYTREDKAPVSYAVEIELSPKSSVELKKILTTFKISMEKSAVPIYRKVIYVIPDDKVKRGVLKAAKSVGLTPDQLVFVTLKDLEGQRFTGRVWEL